MTSIGAEEVAPQELHAAGAHDEQVLTAAWQLPQELACWQLLQDERQELQLERQLLQLERAAQQVACGWQQVAAAVWQHGAGAAWQQDACWQPPQDACWQPPQDGWQLVKLWQVLPQVLQPRLQVLQPRLQLLQRDCLQQFDCLQQLRASAVPLKAASTARVAPNATNFK